MPSNLRETDVNTGIFQVTITIPEEISKNKLERGEEITLTYTDDGPSGADTVGETDRDVELQIETSDFGATIELDQNVYTWTDKVFITAVASDYNFDSNVIDEIGPENDGEITIRVRGDGLKEYRLAETGPDTGVFTGEITLAGFSYVPNQIHRANYKRRQRRTDRRHAQHEQRGRTQYLIRVLRFGSPTCGLRTHPMERRRGAVA